VPAVIAEIADQVFDSGDRFTIENGRPKDRATLRTRYVNGPFDIELAGNYYGLQVSRQQEGGTLPSICDNPPSDLRCEANGDVFLDNGPHFVLDARTGWKISDALEIDVGAENLLDARPAVVPEGFNFLGIFPYESSSGLSMNGRYVYTQLRVKM
jgi:outer membrane receptor protein involved in Fe transport